MRKNEQKYSVRTDLAVEAKEMYVADEEKPSSIRGVKTKNRTDNNVNVSYVTIDEHGAQLIDKKAGSYVTIYADGVKRQDTDRQTNAASVLAKELEVLLHKNKVNKTDKGLIVGLGNWQVTPDALGPMTVNNILVTNHLFELDHQSVADGYRAVASISPGVMGVTGMETSNIVASIIDSFKPDFVIAVDALASRSIERINETIQLTDTGIHPGSGVGNKRKELSRETLGVPVIAIGVPTVVDAVTIASDTLDYLLKHMGREWQEKDRPAKSLTPHSFSFKKRQFTEEDLPSESERTTFLGLIGHLTEAEKRDLIEEVLTPIGRNLVVTPKEVDDIMNDMAHVLAQGINAALHEKVDVTNFAHYTR